MQILFFLSFATLAYSAKLSINEPIDQPINEPIQDITGHSLFDDIDDIDALIPKRDLKHIIVRYLLLDSEYQTIMRYFMSEDANMALDVILAQPEIVDLYSWLQLQMLLNSGTSSGDLYQLLSGPGVISNTPGWAGFMDNLLAIIPLDAINSLIHDKVAANGVFAQFWWKLVALRPMYERVTYFPEISLFINRLEQLGVDIGQLDQLIRTELGWTTTVTLPGPVVG